MLVEVAATGRGPDDRAARHRTGARATISTVPARAPVGNPSALGRAGPRVSRAWTPRYGRGVQLNLPAGDYDALIFDCDGTLVDSMPLHHRAWRSAFADHDARFDFDWPLFMSRAGMGLRETVIELNAQFDEALDPERVVAAQRRHYERLLPELQPILPVVELARRAAKTHRLSVASGGEKPHVLASLAQVGVRELFAHVVCQVDVARGKPHPDIFLRCAELMGSAPERCLVLEDGEPGIEAARRAGMAWVAVDGSGRCAPSTGRAAG